MAGSPRNPGAAGDPWVRRSDRSNRGEPANQRWILAGRLNEPWSSRYVRP